MVGAQFKIVIAAMLDRYTKGVLTVIAVALTVSVIQRAIAPAEAQSPGCGTNLQNPCAVALVTRADRYSDFILCNFSFPCMMVREER